ncbi:MAG: hypothetical protein D6797_06990 [Bdellovibrio sp.]|nr:MAG: hypothetical protein D6797_06990 [Bdellovibrio sp.]
MTTRLLILFCSFYFFMGSTLSSANPIGFSSGLIQDPVQSSKKKQQQNKRKSSKTTIQSHQLQKMKELVRKKASYREVRTFLEGHYLYQIVPFKKMGQWEQEKAFKDTQDLIKVVISDWIQFALSLNQTLGAGEHSLSKQEIEKNLDHLKISNLEQIYRKNHIPPMKSTEDIVRLARQKRLSRKDIKAMIQDKQNYINNLENWVTFVESSMQSTQKKDFQISDVIPDIWAGFISLRVPRSLAQFFYEAKWKPLQSLAPLFNGSMSLLVKVVPFKVHSLDLNTGRLQSRPTFWIETEAWINKDFKKTMISYDKFFRIGIGGLWGNSPMLEDGPLTGFTGVSMKADSSILKALTPPQMPDASFNLKFGTVFGSPKTSNNTFLPDIVRYKYLLLGPELNSPLTPLRGQRAYVQAGAIIRLEKIITSMEKQSQQFQKEILKEFKGVSSIDEAYPPFEEQEDGHIFFKGYQSQPLESPTSP